MAIVDLPGDSSSGLLPDALLPAGLVLGIEQIPHGREGKVEEAGNILSTVLRPVFALLVSRLQGYVQPMRAGLPRPCWRGVARDTEGLGPLVGCRRGQAENGAEPLQPTQGTRQEAKRLRAQASHPEDTPTMHQPPKEVQRKA